MAIKYNKSVVGKITIGPHLEIHVSGVNFINSKRQYTMNVDIREYRNRKNGKGSYTWHGVSFSREDAMKIYDKILKLPPVNTSTERHTEVIRLAKNPRLDLIVGVTVFNDRTSLDFREWVKDSYNGYTGFSNKGTRFSYEYKDDIANLLLEACTTLQDRYDKWLGLK